MPENGNGWTRKLGANGLCPICGKLVSEKFRPFCSKRCADIDLHRWLSGGYVVAGSEDSEEDGAGSGETETPKSRKDQEN